MGNIITNYNFTIIEDTKVPLAATVNTVNYAPVLFAIIGMALIAGIIAYTVWFMSHKAYINNLTGNKKKLVSYFVRPDKLLQLEYEIENHIANQYIA